MNQPCQHPAGRRASGGPQQPRQMTELHVPFICHHAGEPHLDPATTASAEADAHLVANSLLANLAPLECEDFVTHVQNQSLEGQAGNRFVSCRARVAVTHMRCQIRLGVLCFACIEFSK